MSSSLLTPLTVGPWELPHRGAMEPMTRDGSAPDGTPTALNERSCAQPASTALIITEGTVEVAAGVGEEIGADRTGIQISPGNPFNDIEETHTNALYAELLERLAPLELAYLNIAHRGDEELLRALRQQWPGSLILHRGDADVARRVDDIDDGLADVVTFGRMVLANPDFVDRVRSGAPRNDPDPDTYYGGDEHGYVDCPTLARVQR